MRFQTPSVTGTIGGAEPKGLARRLTLRDRRRRREGAHRRRYGRVLARVQSGCWPPGSGCSARSEAVAAGIALVGGWALVWWSGDGADQAVDEAVAAAARAPPRRAVRWRGISGRRCRARGYDRHRLACRGRPACFQPGRYSAEASVASCAPVPRSRLSSWPRRSSSPGCGGKHLARSSTRRSRPATGSGAGSTPAGRPARRWPAASLVHDSIPCRPLACSWSETGRAEAHGGDGCPVCLELTRVSDVTKLITVHDDLAFAGVGARQGPG